MGKGFSNLGEVLLVVLVLAIGYMGGVVTTYEISELGGTETVYSPQYNLSCPAQDKQVEQASNLRTDGSAVNSYIQAPYTEVDYKLGEGEASISIDAVARPEGKSMRPTIFSGNTVLLEEYEGASISEGEILRYETDSGYVIHRVQANYLGTGDYLLMKGDNNRQSSRISRDQITHRVTGLLFTEERPEQTNLGN